jgi:hypothetical protein
MFRPQNMLPPFSSRSGKSILIKTKGPAMKASPVPIPKAVRNAIVFADHFVAWQSSYGGPDSKKCPYRSRGAFSPTQLHSTGPLTRALYALFDATGVFDYKVAADRYAIFHLNSLRDPYGPHNDEVRLFGSSNNRLSRSWLYGVGLSPCYEYFRIHNPKEDALDMMAYACYRYLQKFRRPDSYFGIGYASGTASDGQFSDDLGQVGNGLVGFYRVSRYRKVLDDAKGLAHYFVTDWVKGAGRGVWSPALGNWLLGPWPESGGEHTTGQIQDKIGWGWSAYEDGNYLLRLYPLVGDESMRTAIADKCVKAFQWCFDSCQFEDGSHGMFGRDDKWVGMGAAALLLYFELKKSGVLPPAVEEKYLPRVNKSWQWMLEHTSPDTYPPDGYIRVHGTTTKRPPENLVWLMAWTTEALIQGNKVLGKA